jgi:hypothetical protein
MMNLTQKERLSQQAWWYDLATKIAVFNWLINIKGLKLGHQLICILRITLTTASQFQTGDEVSTMQSPPYTESSYYHI